MKRLHVKGGIFTKINWIEKKKQEKCWVWVLGCGYVREGGVPVAPSCSKLIPMTKFELRFFLTWELQIYDIFAIIVFVIPTFR